MTEQSDAEVALDWARDMGDPNLNLNIPEEDKRQFRALAAALEAADQRAAEYAAVVEKVRGLDPMWPRGMYGCPQDMFGRRQIQEALASAGTDALRERDAEKWGEGAETGHRLYAEPMHVIEARNPYRKEADRD